MTDSDKKADDRPTQENREIEVTPAMIEAGVDELIGVMGPFGPGDDVWDAVTRIYVKMRQLSD
ncbi:MAG: hypothetical protein AB7F96_02600 [Beijerinckiaceae bacterium]